MEPTIYKPSIYKGAGIYKLGAGGGGGSVNSQYLGLYLSTTDSSFTLDIGNFKTGTVFINIGVRFYENSEDLKNVFEIKNNGVSAGYVSIKNGVSSTQLRAKWGDGGNYSANIPSGNTNNSIWTISGMHMDYPQEGIKAYNKNVGLCDVYSHADNDKDFNQITLAAAASGFEIYFIRIKDSSKDLFFYPYKNEGITNGLVDINTGNFIEVLNSFVMPYSY